MRVALVYPPFDDKRDRSAYYVAPPLGLLILASYLEHEHEVRVFDFVFDVKTGHLSQSSSIYADCAARIAATRPDVVCLSTQCTTNPGSVNIARRLKELTPECKIVFGGHDVSFLAHEYLRAFDEIDFVLGGESEHTLPKLMRALTRDEEPQGIAGLSYKAANGEIISTPGHDRVQNLDEMLSPAYHLVAPQSQYFALSRVPTILIDSGRGCAFSCEFCQTTLLSGHKIRYRSVDSIVLEIKALRARHGRFEAYFVHDLFTARRTFVEDLCKRLIEERLDISWQCRCRLDQVDEPLLKLMAAAGCRMLLYGVESGSIETLQFMNKNLRRGTERQVLERVRQTVDAGIFPSLSMVVGLPEETLDGLNATMALAHDFTALGNVNAFIQLMSPLPGTALAKRLEDRLSYRGANAPTAFSQGIEFDNGQRVREDDDLISKYPHIFQSFQVVVPDHGDLDLCIDVSTTYCKLLEVYGRTYRLILEKTGETHLQLFVRWRAGILQELGQANLGSAKDWQIWHWFETFACDEARNCSPTSKLKDTLLLEKFIHRATVEQPVRPQQGSLPEDVDLALHPMAGLFPLSVLTGQFPNGKESEKQCLVFMGADRLHAVSLPPEFAMLLKASRIPSLPETVRAKMSQMLRQGGQELIRMGVIVPLAQQVQSSALGVSE